MSAYRRTNQELTERLELIRFRLEKIVIPDGEDRGVLLLLEDQELGHALVQLYELTDIKRDPPEED